MIAILRIIGNVRIVWKGLFGQDCMGRIVWPNTERSASYSERVKRKNYFKVIIEYSGPGAVNSKGQSCPSTSYEDIQGGVKV